MKTKGKGVSPLIGTLLLIIVAVAIAGITIAWSQSYTQETAQTVSEDISSYAQVTQQSFSLRINSADRQGNVVVENIGISTVTVTNFRIDNNSVDVNDFELQPGMRYIFDVGTLSVGEHLITVEGENGAKKQEIIEVTATLQTLSFQDSLDNNSNISDSNSVLFSASTASLNGTPLWKDTGDVNVSDTSGDSQYSSLALDSNGDPHIAWQDDYTIYYRDWNGSDWVDANGQTGITADLNVSKTYQATRPSLALDSNGNPHITWNYVSGLKLYHRYWNGGGWQTLGSGVIGDTGGSNPSSLVIDSNNRLHVAWEYSNEIYYRDWNGSSWGNTVNISNTAGAISMYPFLVVDSNNTLHVAWMDYPGGGNAEIYYRYCQSNCSNANNWLDANGQTGITADLNVSKNPQNSQYPSLAIDSNNRPHIAWDESLLGGFGEIYYRRWSGSSWVDTNGQTGMTADLNVSKTIGNSLNASLALDSQGTPNIVWGEAAQTIYHVFWDGNRWTSYTNPGGASNVSTPYTNSWYPRMRLDSQGRPKVSWARGTFGGEIYFKYYIFPRLPSGYLNSKEIDATSDEIIKATLTATVDIPAATGITFYLSNDNGATWETATLGAEHTFATAGSQLRWRAILNTSSSAATPEIDSVSINYTYYG